ncbi:unnamed protein product [Vicia faba]|uniref:Uncharacterized protein n=1 Tax=Vicia faba TaxID=3906 RepID=A0AAV0ZI20_VICFA|nr:unnamed protein product [Vicia faba]
MSNITGKGKYEDIKNFEVNYVLENQANPAEQPTKEALDVALIKVIVPIDVQEVHVVDVLVVYTFIEDILNDNHLEIEDSSDKESLASQHNGDGNDVVKEVDQMEEETDTEIEVPIEDKAQNIVPDETRETNLRDQNVDKNVMDN